MKINEHLSHIGTLTVLPAFEGVLREERHIVDEHRACLVELQRQLAFRSRALGREGGSQLRPVIHLLAGKSSLAQRLASIAITKAGSNCALIVGALHIETQVVLLTLSEPHAPVASIRQQGSSVLLHLGDSELHSMWRILMKGLRGFNHLTLHGALHAFDAPARHRLLLHVPGDIPMADVAMLVVGRFHGPSPAVTIGHAGGEHLLLETTVLN